MNSKVNTDEAARQFNELAQETQATALRDAIERLIKSGFNPESEAIRVLESALIGTEHREAERKIIKAIEATGLYVRSLKTERDYPNDATYTATISHSRGITIDTGDSIVDL